MKIRTKLISLVSLLMLVFAASLLLQIKLEQRRLNFVFKGERQEKIQIFNKILELKGKSAETVAVDYTYWDEMVDFVTSRDKAWAEQNLDTTFSTFGINALWVFSPDLSLVYSSNNLEDDKLKESPLSKEALNKIFSQKRLSHFYITAGGVWEIRTASIHPTADPQRMTPPRGYFIVGRLLNKEFLEELSFFMAGEVTIVDPQAAAAAAAAAGLPLKTLPAKGSEIVFFKQLDGWDGKPVAALKIIEKSLTVESYKYLSRWVYSSIIVITFISLLIIAFYLTRLITIPLRLISLALSSENSDLIKKLKTRKTEFGEIAGLIHKSFNQRSDLIKESAERERIEGELKKKLELLEKFNKVAVDRELKMVELKKRIQELEQKLGRENVG